MARHAVVGWEGPGRFRLVEALPPVGKIICLGLSYRDHCAEQNVTVPERPLLFAKFPSALQVSGKPVVKPRETVKLDYEAELAIVIGKRARNVTPAAAAGHVFGYMNFNDVSARDIQFAERQWTRAKSFDTFAPCGPFVVTRDEIHDPQHLAIRCWVNGELRQGSNTSNLVFSVPQIVSHVSQTMTLEAGDVIATGTPAGVGVFHHPPRFLEAGDTVEIEIEGLGRLVSMVEDEN